MRTIPRRLACKIYCVAHHDRCSLTINFLASWVHGAVGADMRLAPWLPQASSWAAMPFLPSIARTGCSGGRTDRPPTNKQSCGVPFMITLLCLTDSESPRRACILQFLNVKIPWICCFDFGNTEGCRPSLNFEIRKSDLYFTLVTRPLLPTLQAPKFRNRMQLCPKSIKSIRST
ncbi:hypothetical protein FB567DRAFT_153557 [Paraphoma chrysanthemicola]|uniref:Uncharacterized protein n=1 Tax=Paraphoma chrysanthemicola TaxID=798071 RepID=A0A8K0VTQ6_9PLEO|nr:hypothetical protein FB567DRAFT_153557 [Paraphoma chrysanthemicola]